MKDRESHSRALIVEADEQKAFDLGRWLGDAGFSREVSTSMEGAETRLSQGAAPSLILLDLDLRDVNEYSLVRFLESWGVEQKIKIWLLSEDPTNVRRSLRHVRGYCGIMKRQASEGDVQPLLVA